MPMYTVGERWDHRSYLVSAAWLMTVAFAFFLLLIFVGIEPFKVRDVESLTELATGEGDTIRQLAYLVAFSLITGVTLAFRGVAMLRTFPLSILLVLVWCFLSTIWSVAPEITVRRAGLTTIIALSVFMAVEILGPRRSLSILYAVLAGILVVNFLSLPFLSQSIHQLGEIDPALVGAWRGIYFHKNIAGPIAALSAFLFLHKALEQRRMRDWFLFLGAVVFTIGSVSKTSIALLPIVLITGALYRFAENRPSWRRPFVFGFVSFMLLAAFALLIFKEELAYWINNPEIFTGRGAIWQIVMAYVSEHALFGSGYNAFWGSGQVSPVLELAMADWLTTVSHSHNGYLEMLVTTGSIGLTLTIISVVVLPLFKLLAFHVNLQNLGFLLFSWITFVLLLNFTEVRLFERDRPEWVLLLFAFALLNHYQRSSSLSN